jgi:hypothetical protein
MRILIALLVAGCIQAQIERPRIGLARGSDGIVRRVSGISGNVVVGGAVARGSLRFGSYGDLAVVKTAESVHVLDSDGGLLFETEAPAGPAVIGFAPGGKQALVYFSETGGTMRCTRSACTDTGIHFSEQVRAVALNGRGEAIFGTENEIVRVRLSDGAVSNRSPIDQPASLISPQGAAISLPEGTEADWMAEGWACVQDAKGHSSALRLATREASVLAADTAPNVVLFDGSTEKPLSAFTDLGSWPAGDVRLFRFRLRNDTAGALELTSVAVSGQGFRIATTPTLPYTIAPQNFAEFRIEFNPPATGAYSAILRVNRTEFMIRATAVAAPTVSVETNGVANDVTSGSPIDFGRIERKSSAVRHIRIGNGNSTALSISPVSLAGDAFRLTPPPAVPLTLDPGGSTGFDIVFEPETSGQYKGTLSLGGVEFQLTGVAFDPPLPRPIIDAGGPKLPSAQQQKLAIRFGAPSESVGTGTLIMEFRPSAPSATDDSAVRFLSGGARKQSFRVAEGDAIASFGSEREVLFQTGTTAGTLTFTAELGTYSEQFSVQIAGDRPQITANGARSAGLITVTLTGYDNTRSAGQLSFTFYDQAGRTISPAIPADASDIFKRFFADDPAGGGTFLLRAAFPVAGDISTLASVDVKMSNSAGQTSIDRVPIK